MSNKKNPPTKRGAFTGMICTLLAFGLSACGNTELVELCKSEDDSLSPFPSKPGAIEIPFYITHSMVANPEWRDSEPGEEGPPREVCTPPAYKEYVNRVLQLYASIDEFDVTFKYAGAYTRKSEFINDHPVDGALYFFLNNPAMMPIAGVAGVGQSYGPWGAPGTFSNDTSERPTTYPGGSVILLPHHDARTVIHEVGHALGLSHMPTTSLMMTYQGYFAMHTLQNHFKIGEQDKADLIDAFPTPGAKSYTIAGTVKADGLSCRVICTSEKGPLAVHAANIVTGRAFTALAFWDEKTPGEYKYRLNVSEPGDYKVVAVLLTKGETDPSTRESSWYVDGTTATNDPAVATALSLSDSSTTLTNIDVPLGTEPNTSWFDHIREKQFSKDTFPLFLSPGETTTNVVLPLDWWDPPRAHKEPYDSIQVFGSSPDVTISEVKNTDGVFGFRITAAANAKPGDRLVVAKAGAKYIAGLIGINVLTNDNKPINVKHLDLVKGQFDVTQLNPRYWK